MLPMIDTSQITAGKPNTDGGQIIFRAASQLSNLPTPPRTGGVLQEYSSADGPGWSWDDTHPTTRNPWASIAGGPNFQEFMVAFSLSSVQTYLVLNGATWAINTGGTNNGMQWQSSSSSGITGSGTTLQQVTAALQPWGCTYTGTITGPPQQ